MSDENQDAAQQPGAENPQPAAVDPHDKLFGYEIEQAYELIYQSNHPLAKTSVADILKTHFFCCCCKKPSKEEEEKKEIAKLEKEEEKEGINVNDEATQKQNRIKILEEMSGDESDINDLGFGINYYFYTIKAAIMLFLVLTILSAPMIYWYGKYEGYPKSDLGILGLNRYSIGDLGFSADVCHTGDLAENIEISLVCNTGHMTAAYEAFGVVTYTQWAADKKWCINNDETKTCDDNIDNAYVAGKFKTACNGKSTCAFSLSATDMFNNVAARDGKDCGLGAANHYFIQFFCEQDATTLAEKEEIGWFIASLDVLICFVFLFFVAFLKWNMNKKEDEWDAATVTAGDYAIKCRLERKFWESFCNENKDKLQSESKVEAFRTELKSFIEELVKSTKAVKDKHEQNLSVATIDFAFDNDRLIHLLFKRGKLLTANKKDKLHEIDEEINKIKDEKPEIFQRPVMAFIIMDSEEGKLRALRLNKKMFEKFNLKSDLTFQGHQIFFESAPEPSNIIWENLMVRKHQRLTRMVISLIIIGALFVGAFAIFFYAQKTVYKYTQAFPSYDCSAFDSANTNADDVKAAAFANYEYITKHPGTPVSTAFECFCEKRAEDGDLPNHMYSSAGYKDTEICVAYWEGKANSYFIKEGVSFAIIGINFVLRTVVMILMKWVRFPTISDEMDAITMGIFFAQFFNTAILLLLVNANLPAAGINIKFFDGPYPDFDFSWYPNIGMVIVQTMVINIFTPLIEFVPYWFLRNFKRFLDKECSFSCDKFKTKKKTKNEYISLYSGPAFTIYYRYSGMLTIFFVSMFYGAGMPVLFPIGFISFVVIYIVEIFLFYYWYTKPPMYDSTISKSVIAILPTAALFNVLVAYWMVGNKQIFYNQYLHTREMANSVPDTEHTVSEYVRTDHSVLLFAFSMVLLFEFIVRPVYAWLVTEIEHTIRGPAQLDKALEAELMSAGVDYNPDENLKYYFDSLTYGDCQWWLAEDKECKEGLGFTLLTEEQIGRLNKRIDEFQDDSKPMTDLLNGNVINVHCYDILSNDAYWSAFNYFSASSRQVDDKDRDREAKMTEEEREAVKTKRANEAERSEVVRELLQLPYQSQETIDGFLHKPFNEEAFKTEFKKKMGAKLKGALKGLGIQNNEDQA